MKKFFKVLSVSLAAFSLIILVVGAVISNLTPDKYNVTSEENDDFYISYWPVSAKSINYTNRKIENADKIYSKRHDADIMFMNLIPIKRVNVDIISNAQVIPCGNPFGIKIFTQGVVVVGMEAVNSETGHCSPAKEAGLKKGDVIKKINGIEVNTNEDVSKIVEGNDGSGLDLEISRDNMVFNTTLIPVKSANDNAYKIGLWVRDSSAGIGTLTFYDEQTKSFAGLGHGICDIDTCELLPLMKGDIVKANINGINKGVRGTPGELRGYFNGDEPIGNLTANINTGIYGYMENKPSQNEPIPVSMKQEVTTGSAKVLTTIDGEEPQYYDIEIVSVNYNENYPTKNMVVSITDPVLLEKTGGIVQGMSGSPIIKDGALVGAVTHVFVNDPTRGYGIFAENMLVNSRSINEKGYNNAS